MKVEDEYDSVWIAVHFLYRRRERGGGGDAVILLKKKDSKKEKRYWSHVDRVRGWSGISDVLIHWPTFVSCSVEIVCTSAV